MAEEDREPLSSEAARLQSEVGSHAHYPRTGFRFFEQLRQRNVFRVGALYLVVSWLILDPVHVVFHMLDVPIWADRLVIVLLAIGFPATLVFAWVYEVTPEGLKPTVEVAHGQSVRRQTGRRLDRAIMAVLAVALTYFVIDKFWLSRRTWAPETVATAATSAAMTATSAPAASPPAHSVAVLPFVNMSGDASQEYFSDGLSEELIDVLTKIPELRVPARTSSFYFKGKQTTIAEVAKVLGVANVLEGSVRRSGEQLRITAQLIRADNGYHLWSETYNSHVDDVFKIQDEIAGAIAQVMRIQLLNDSPPMRATPSTQAHDVYLQAQYFQGRDDREGREKAVVYYRKAVDADPNYAAAWAALALATRNQVTLGELSAEVGDRQARDAATRALQLDPGLPAAHRAMADVYIGDLRWDLAEDQANIALKLDPNDPSNLNFSANVALLIRGNSDQDIRLYEQAVARDPVDMIFGINLCRAYRNTGRLDEAEHQCRALTEFRPDSSELRVQLGRVLLDKGQVSAARAEFAKVTDPENRLYADVIVNFAAGHRAESDAALEKLTKEYASVPLDIAAAHASRGEVDQAFDWLERPLPHGVWGVVVYLRSEAFATFKQHPRYVALLKRLRLPQ
jgi:TolB-like protein/Tfp pilus assembly protein PilF